VPGQQQRRKREDQVVEHQQRAIHQQIHDQLNRRLAAAGCTNREIAQLLFVTERTVEVHLTSAYRKLGIRSRRDLPPNPAPSLTGSHHPLPDEQLPCPQEHPVQHRLGQSSGLGILLPQRNVSTPKRDLPGDDCNSVRRDRERCSSAGTDKSPAMSYIARLSRTYAGSSS
jgi:Bacterial regulatory proteins, luxR family